MKRSERLALGLQDWEYILAMTMSGPNDLVSAYLPPIGTVFHLIGMTMKILDLIRQQYFSPAQIIGDINSS